MMNGIAGIATAGASSAAAEAAGGNMNFGSVRANAVNMNKYDATHAVSAGNSSKLSMDTQQTASNQSSARTGTENLDKNSDVIHHEGSTWITDSQTGKTYEVNGQFKSISGGWEGSGNIREYDKNGTYIGEYNGKITGSGDMDDYKRDVIRGGHGGKENAFKAASVVSSNLDASNIKHQDDINTRNTVDEQNSRYTRTVEKDLSKIHKENNIYEKRNINDTRDIKSSGSETIEGDKFTSDNTNNINEGFRVNTSNTFTSGEKTTNYGNAVEYTNPYNSLMTGGHDKVMGGFYKDYAAIQNGSSSKSMEQLESEILNYTKQLSADMPASLSQTYKFEKNRAGGENTSTTSNESMGLNVGASGGAGVAKGGGKAGGENGGGLSGSGSGNAGVHYSTGMSNTETHSHGTVYSDIKGGSSSQDMMAQHLHMKVMQDMKSLHNMNALANDETGKFLASNLGNYVEDKIKKPF